MSAPPSKRPSSRASFPDQRLTLYLTGFPADVKEREIRNLFRFLPGFVGFVMTMKKKPRSKDEEGKDAKSDGKDSSTPSSTTSGGEDNKDDLTTPMVFALFETEVHASDAKEMLDGTKFDYRDASSPSFRISWAKKNLTLPPDHFATEDVRYHRRRPASSPYDPYYPPPPPSSPYYPPSSSSSSAPYSSSKKRKFDDSEAQPSNTLFISNVPESANDEEIRSVFKSTGSSQINIHRKNGRLVIFVEYPSIDAATSAMQKLEGHPLQSAPSTQMHVVYSKTSFMQKRSRPPTSVPSSSSSSSSPSSSSSGYPSGSSPYPYPYPYPYPSSSAEHNYQYPPAGSN